MVMELWLKEEVDESMMLCSSASTSMTSRVESGEWRERDDGEVENEVGVLG